MPLRELASVYDPKGDANADWIVRLPNAFFVIDGASSLRGETIAGLSSASWLARMLGEALENLPTANIEAALRQAVQAIAERARELGGDGSEFDTPFCCLIGCIEHDDVIELVSWGDCQALIWNGDRSNHELFGYCSVTELDSAVTRTVNSAKKAGLTHREAFSGSIEQIEANRERRNVDAGYQIIDLRPPYVGIPERRYLDKRTARRIVMTTDGLFRAASCYNSILLSDFAAINAQDKLLELLASTRMLEKGDATCDRYPRLKPSDDVAAIVLEFLPPGVSSTASGKAGLP